MVAYLAPNVVDMPTAAPVCLVGVKVEVKVRILISNALHWLAAPSFSVANCTMKAGEESGHVAFGSKIGNSVTMGM